MKRVQVRAARIGSGPSIRPAATTLAPPLPSDILCKREVVGRLVSPEVEAERLRRGDGTIVVFFPLKLESQVSEAPA